MALVYLHCTTSKRSSLLQKSAAMAIPVIDFSKLDGAERAKIMAQIANGCEEWGFFQLVNHGISEELLERVKKVSSDCFKFEREEGFKKSTPVKMLNEILGEKNNDRLENMDWEDVFLLSDDNQNDWPSQTPNFRETMKEYRRELKKLAEKIMEIMDENLGLQKGYIKKAFNGGGKGDDEDEEVENAFFGTKVSHYPPCPYPEKVTGLRAHTDAGGVILLFQDDKVGGLQILKEDNNNGGGSSQWIDVQPLPNSIVINIGDQIEVLSNGRYKSVWHRVLATTNGNRRSIASFYNPSLKATIAPAPELLLAENVQQQQQPQEEEDANNNGNNNIIQRYPKFVFGDYMSVYVQQKFLPKEPRFQAVKAM